MPMFKRRIVTHTKIEAPPARVWAILTDFDAMPQWNPFIREIAGDLVEGGRLRIKAAPEGQKAARFTPTILVVRPERELRWRGRLALPGLFEGEHYFLLEPDGDTRTRFTHGENFAGLLVAVLGRMLEATERGFLAMNAALKDRAETAEARADPAR
jgi:hypothetical protein